MLEFLRGSSSAWVSLFPLFPNAGIPAGAAGSSAPAREAPEHWPETDAFPLFSLISLFSLLPPSAGFHRLSPLRWQPRSLGRAEFVCCYPGFWPQIICLALRGCLARNLHPSLALWLCQTRARQGKAGSACCPSCCLCYRLREFPWQGEVLYRCLQISPCKMRGCPKMLRTKQYLMV